jgi:hypothetical protein
MINMEIKARLKQDVTEKQFLIATFYDEGFNVGDYDFDAMKNTDLTGRINKDGSLYINVLRLGDDSIGFEYEKEDTNIWDYEIA